ncbi:Ribosomal protein L34Ae [Quillaja saponaria]|uniref:Ribosomal protein L34Ae n=1 Tax=Quillaja saponaria TaxID=32244 RepID=A0AAD7PE09_QUISA|nr:Ribosomal protein L34Ae [Quillaja saponaria]
MDFFKIKKFRKAQRPGTENEEDKPVTQPEEPKNVNDGNDLCKSDPATEAEDDDDDDFITNEVKRRLKELRRNSFMVLIPEEEPCPEEEEEEEVGETSSSEWRDVEAEGQQWWRGFDAVFDKYCERMLFFDRMSLQQINEVGKGLQYPSTPSPSPRSASKKLTSPLRCLSLKKLEEPDDETEHLQQPENDPYQDIETAYVGQICLTWEALHCQYTQMSQKISCQPENPTCYNQSAQHFQQFQVLLQRFIENEPFEQGQRADIYARTRNLLPKLLQVPNVQGSDQQLTEDDSDTGVLAPDLIKIIENAILTFHLFLKMDKKKPNGVLNRFGNQNQLATPHQQIQSSLEKKAMKLKELRKRKGWKNKSWPQTREDVQLLLGLIDIKVLSRVLRMTRITKEELFWCEEKMKKLDLSDGKLQRDPTPILFPC